MMLTNGSHRNSWHTIFAQHVLFCNLEYLLWKNVNTRDTRQSWFVSKNYQKSKYELIPVTQTVYQVRMIRRLLGVLKYT